MQEVLVFGAGFAVLGVCLLALVVLDRRRFWNIAPPATHKRPRSLTDKSDGGDSVDRHSRVGRYDRSRYKPTKDWDPSHP